jgi:hypothetical protein
MKGDEFFDDGTTEKGSFINDVHQKMGFLDPPPPLVTKFSFKKISFV